MNVRKVFAKFHVGILVVLGLYVFFGSLIGVGIRKVVGEKKESHEAVKAIQTEVEQPSEDKVTRFTIGDTIINRDYKLTVEGASIIVSDNKYAQPDENCEFVEVELTLENTSNDTLNVRALYFTAYADGFIIDSHNWHAYYPSSKNILSADLASGKKINGVLCYEVPNDWSELELFVKLSDYFGNDADAILVIKKEQVTKLESE